MTPIAGCFKENMEENQKIEPHSLQTVEAMILHPAIKDSWLCEQLYGELFAKKRSTVTAKFSYKKAGKFPFKKWELERLEEIRLQLLAA